MQSIVSIYLALAVILYANFVVAVGYRLPSRSLTMKMIIVPRGAPVTFDFTVIAGAKGAEWGTVVESFPATAGKVMMTCVASVSNTAQ
jgi:hypothetical protein